MRSEDVDQLVRDLGDEITAVFPGSNPHLIHATDGVRVDESSPRYVRQLHDGQILAVIRPHGVPIAALRCRPISPPSELDLQFLAKLVRLFSSDLRAIRNLRQQEEIWSALQRSRFPRAVARVSAFSTSPLISWLDQFEVAAVQTYEGQRFAGRVIFTKQLQWITAKAEKAFIRISPALSFSDAMQSEKWVRPLLATGDLALVGLGHSGKVVGVLACGSETPKPAVLLPHERLAPFYQYLVPGTATVVGSESGDTFVSLPNGLTFAKSQGRWRYHGYEALQAVVAERLTTDLATNVLQLVLNLSFDRMGALIVFVLADSPVTDLVPDHNALDQVAASLRRSVAGLSLHSTHERRVIGAAAGADGAIVLDETGQVLDAACMISEPTPDLRKKHGVMSLRRFSGARTTAAWNASFVGLAIKVSDDGPIEVYADGVLRARMG